VLSQAEALASGVDAALAEFDTQRAGRLLSTFVDDLSNWYVRRSRRRFWNGDAAALATLHEALRVLTLTLAPFTPFITERVWQDLFRPVDDAAPVSVHLATWPTPDASWADPRLDAQMALVRDVVELGRAARASSAVRTRQPLRRALVAAPGWPDLPADLRQHVAEELNVVDLQALADADANLVDVTVKANFRSLGARFAKQTPAVAAAIGATDAQALVSALRSGGRTSVSATGIGEVEIGMDDVVVSESPREGWAVASDAAASVALDLELDEHLIRAGLAREVVRAIQEGRKAAGLEVTDRIQVWWECEDRDVAAAIVEHQDTIAAEVLAIDLAPGSGLGTAHDVAAVPMDLALSLRLQRA